MNDRPEWFAPKKFGIGASLPISWQGWALTIAFITLVALAGLLLRHHHASFITALAILVAAFTLICARTTRGGWHWRWGSRD